MKTLLLVTILASAALRAEAQAPPPKRPILRLYSGLTIPSAPEAYSSYWKNGFILGGALGYPVTHDLNLEAQLTMNSNPFDIAALLAGTGLTPADVTLTGAGTTITTATVSGIARTMSDAPISGYLSLGAGLLHRTVRDGALTGPGGAIQIQGTSNTAVLFDAGVGIEVHAAERAGFFVEPRYAVGLTPDDVTRFLQFRLGLIIR
jgi:hypothetical protein